MRWLFIGDSITVGIAPTLGKHMVALGQKADIVCKVSMDVESALEDPLVQRALEKQYEAVVVLLGTNPFGIMSVDRFREGATALRNKVWQVSDCYGWIGPWAGDDYDSRLRVIRELVGYKWADGIRMAGTLERAGETRVHFTPDAYKALAWRVADWSVRVVNPRALTVPRSGGKVVAAAGILGAGVVPMLPWWLR